MLLNNKWIITNKWLINNYIKIEKSREQNVSIET